jgi:integrase
LQQANDSDKKTKVVISSPKSDSSIRAIPLPDEIYKLLQQNRKQSDAYLLTGLPNRYMEPRLVQSRFKSILLDLGIKHANFHALRHTFATRCVELGFDIKSLSEILGHSTVNITLNRYVHPSMDLKQKNMNMLSDLFTVS